ncbi:putative zeaxanthin epoxidase [Helianthus anomalus]
MRDLSGLVFALAAKRRGFEVVVFERDLSAIRAIDLDVADQVMQAGCITGQRINGLVDGVSGNWLIVGLDMWFKVQTNYMNSRIIITQVIVYNQGYMHTSLVLTIK